MLTDEIRQLKKEISAAESAIEALKNDRPRPIEAIGDSVFEQLKAAIGNVGKDEEFNALRLERLAVAERSLDNQRALLLAKQFQLAEDEAREAAIAKERAEIGARINSLVSELQDEIKKLGSIEIRCDLQELPWYSGGAIRSQSARSYRPHQSIVFQPLEQPRDPNTAIGVDPESAGEVAKRRAALTERQKQRLIERRKALLATDGFFGN
ncbi:hypothetical protein [Phormidesmis sp. 146-33]